ncbi:MAG: Na(+)-translocating NADH-quinone reductase subunit A [Lentimicrobiaceae bacterium]|nr:Na(+)-translocating NADH-quinone reductase subunit A [Lentimicrobiaceae bacterium]
MIKIKKGIDIHLVGEAKKEVKNYEPQFFALKPHDFIGVVPKMHVAEGDDVKVGTVLFHDKNNESVFFTSPASGKVKAIVRGEKRVILQVIVESDGTFETIDFGKADPSKLSRNEIVEKLVQSGTWTMLRQRPYSTIAKTQDEPKCIAVSMFDTAPLAPDNNFIVKDQMAAIKAGVEALAKLTKGMVYLNVNSSETQQALASLNFSAKNVTITEFQGPHPTGNVSTQLNVLSPINKGETVWYTYAQNLIAIGNLFLNGVYDSSRVVAFTGSEVKEPMYYRTRIGADMSGLYANIATENVRIISGNVLTGKKINGENFLGYYDSQVTVIPEGDHYQLFGWLAPNFKKFTSTNTMGASLCKKSKKVLDTNLNGGVRPFVMTGNFEKVFPFDIYPMQLIKACIIKDIDQMEELGIYEIDAEDFALCEVIDPSKTAIQQIVRESLEMLRKEMN